MGFRIPTAVFRIPKPKIPDFTSKNVCEIPPIPEKRNEQSKESISQVQDEFKGCSTANDAKTNKNRGGSRINDDRFPNRAPKAQASKGEGAGSGGMHLGVIFMGF